MTSCQQVVSAPRGVITATVGAAVSLKLCAGAYFEQQPLRPSPARTFLRRDTHADTLESTGSEITRELPLQDWPSTKHSSSTVTA